MTNIINRRGSVVHIANDYSGIRKVNGRVGNIVKDIAQRQLSQNFNVKVVVPNVEGMDISGFEKITKSVSYRLVDGVPVYMITEKSFSSVYPSGKNAADEYEAFAKGFMELIRDPSFGKVGVVHAHDYGMGIVLPLVDSGVSRIFTMYDPTNYDQLFSLGKHHKDVYVDPFRGFAHHEQLSGVKAGILSADIVTSWGDAFLSELREGQYSEFLRNIEISKPLYRLGHGWTPRDHADIPDQVIDAMTTAYLMGVYGKAHRFSMNVGSLPIEAKHILIQAHERRPDIDERGAMIERGIKEETTKLKMKDDTVKTVRRISKDVFAKVSDPEAIMKIRQALVDKNISLGHTDNLGGLAQMFEEITKPGYDKEGLYLALLTGGVGERLMNIGMSAGGVKGEVMLGQTTLNKVAIEQGNIIAHQLPNEGKGFVVMFGNDNLMIPQGPIMVGEKLLGSAKQKIFLLAQPERVKNLPENANIDYLKGLGIMLADPITGELMEFYEKKTTPDKQRFDVDFVTDRLDDIGSDYVFKNTFYMAMSADVAEIFAKKYSAPTSRDGKPFHETYSLDWSKMFVEATIASKADWMARYDVKGKFDVKDWEYLWDSAQEIKAASGGIGVANIGQEAIWSDVGTIKELSRLYFNLVSENEAEREIYRRTMKLSAKNVDDVSVMDNVTLTDSRNVLVNHSVFAKGGKIGKNCVIINSFFDEYVDIPNNTVIIGSHIVRIDKDHALQNQRKFVYNVHKAEGDGFWFKGDVAVASVFFHEGTFADDSVTRIGEFPINLTGKEVKRDSEGQFVRDVISGHYIMNGEMTKQPIKGIRGSLSSNPDEEKGISVVDAKYLYSVTRSKAAFEELMSLIDSYIAKTKG